MKTKLLCRSAVPDQVGAAVSRLTLLSLNMVFKTYYNEHGPSVNTYCDTEAQQHPFKNPSVIKRLAHVYSFIYIV